MHLLTPKLIRQQSNEPGAEFISGIIGQPMNRVDGRLKVTGAARYCAEIPIKNVAHAVLVGSTIPSGRITSIDTEAAREVKGVLQRKVNTRM